MHARNPKSFRLSILSPIMENPELKRRLTLEGMIRTAEKMTKETIMKEACLMIKVAEVTELDAPCELGPQMCEAMRRMQKAMCHICLFHNEDSEMLKDENDLTRREFLIDFVNWW